MVDLIVNGVNVKDEYGLILSNREIGSPEVSRVLVEVPGRDGLLDLTNAVYGRSAVYKNRQIVVELVTNGDDSDVFHQVMMWHGANVEIAFSDDADWHWNGFCSVANSSEGGHYQTITLTCDCAPYQINGTNRRL